MLGLVKFYKIWRTYYWLYSGHNCGCISNEACIVPLTETLYFTDSSSVITERRYRYFISTALQCQYKLGVIVHQCLQNKAPQYLVDCCKRTSDVSSRQHLWSANRYQLIVPRHRRSMFGRRAFSVAGPMEWNSLPDSPGPFGVLTVSDRL